MRKFWLSPWRPQQPLGISAERLARGDEEREFVHGIVRLDHRAGGWGWTIWVDGKIVEAYPGWGAGNKREGLRRAERAARAFAERQRRPPRGG